MKQDNNATVTLLALGSNALFEVQHASIVKTVH